jgi:GTP-binding protein HflX
MSAATGSGIELLREAIARTLQQDRVHCWLQLPVSAGRLRARLFESGFVAGERAADEGWEIEIDAPRRLLEPLFGLPDGAGDWLRRQLAAPGGGTYNSAATTL